MVEAQKLESFDLNRFLSETISEFFDLILEPLLKNLRGIREESWAAKDQHCAEPQGPGERVGEVDDGEDEGQELAEGQNEGDRQRSAFSGQQKHWQDADVLKEIKCTFEPVAIVCQQLNFMCNFTYGECPVNIPDFLGDTVSAKSTVNCQSQNIKSGRYVVGLNPVGGIKFQAQYPLNLFSSISNKCFLTAT